MKRHITSAISQKFGKFASKEFGSFTQSIINNAYVNLMGLDMSEFSKASSYKSLNALFTRKLKKNRTFSNDNNDIISPCDSLISECGKLNDDYALQIKGMEYKTDELLGDNFSEEEKSSIHNGDFINLKSQKSN
jgi:phosphatidylserine decarboxylase